MKTVQPDSVFIWFYLIVIYPCENRSYWFGFSKAWFLPLVRTVHTGSVSLDHSLPGCNTAVVCASVAPWRDDPSARSVCSCLSTETRYNTILFIERHTKNTTFWSYNGLWSIFFFQNIPFRIQYNSSSFLSFFFFYYLKPVMKELKCSNQTPAIHATFINVRHQHVCQINILRYSRSKVYDSILSNITPLT